MRNMSFALTQDAYCSGAKTLTRRDGWNNLRPDDMIMGVNRCMGFKKGEHPVKFGPSIIIRAIREPITEIIRRPFRRINEPEDWKNYTKHCPLLQNGECRHKGNLGECCGFFECPGASEVAREGFPAWVGREEEFVKLYLKANPKGGRDKTVNRIEFARVVA
jgi:hypothetical protein